MQTVLLALLLSADPAPALASLSGLNPGSLKPWLLDQLPSLAQCVLPNLSEGDDLVTVQAQFGKAPEVSALRVDGKLNDIACVRGVVDGWKRDAKQPTAGAFSFKYRFKPSAAQREAVAAQARKSFASMCALLPKELTVDSVKTALTGSKLPIGMRVTIEDALVDAEAIAPATVSVTLSRALRDAAASYNADQCMR